MKNNKDMINFILTHLFLYIIFIILFLLSVKFFGIENTTIVGFTIIFTKLLIEDSKKYKNEK